MTAFESNLLTCLGIGFGFLWWTIFLYIIFGGRK